MTRTPCGRLDRTVRCGGALLGLLATFATGCLGDIDFDAIAPECDAPAFDRPNRDTWCSGRVEVGKAVDARVPGEAMVLASDEDAVLVLGGEPRGEAPLTDWFTRFSVRWLPQAAVASDGSFDGAEGLERTFSLTDFGQGANPIPPPTRMFVFDHEQGIVGMNVVSGLLFLDMNATGTMGVTSLVADARLPLKTDDNFLFFRDPIVTASPQNPTRRRIVVVPAVGALKPFYFEKSADGHWDERRPEIPPALRDPLTGGKCTAQCVDATSASCLECASASWALLLPGDDIQTLAWSVAVDDPSNPTRAYVGSLAGIHAMDAILLDPFDAGLFDEGGTARYEQAFMGRDVWWDAPLSGDGGTNLIHTFNGLHVRDGVLWASAFAERISTRGDDPILFTPSRPVLFALELDADGRIASRLSSLELPFDTTLQWQGQITPVGPDMIAVQSVDTVLSEDALPRYRASDVAIVDVSDPAAPFIVYATHIDTMNHALGMATVGQHGNGATLLLPAAGQTLMPIEAELGGKLLP